MAVAETEPAWMPYGGSICSPVRTSLRFEQADAAARTETMRILRRVLSMDSLRLLISSRSTRNTLAPSHERPLAQR